ncbi:YHS domain-containing (seleno)protein [Aquimarina sp. 2201CG5-10]|uniref:YHS domain-containing (seleno)protein n=1 Tax=Aquimarina callyspongiae TaxID=3098150 RepID=UPI002AB33D72|nr:YHS domain-containing (seleno)protein [Aquimarina sp. 2201CG5-10]MDY8134978.1 YHS domain-containing (seleno)protein [Aquimarina sp. 2201CG5-10]
MNKFFVLLFLGFAFTIQAQQIDYNTKKGYVAEGYDVTEYFNNKAVKGNSKFSTTHDNVKYKFTNQANLDKFKSNPGKYVPQYGGYCAYAVGANAEKVSIDPETFEIRDGKLYLFYNSWGVNTLKKWNEEGAEQLKSKADVNWQKIKTK